MSKKKKKTGKPGNNMKPKNINVRENKDIYTSGNNFKLLVNLREKNKYQLILACLLLFFLVIITYQGATKNGLVDWDDNDYVVNNDLVRNQDKTLMKDIFATVISLNYHPVTIMSMQIHNNICKTCPNEISAKPFIRGNIILHLLNSIFVLVLIFLLSERNIIISFLVAALFAVHPMHVESVAWVSERKDVLYSFFFLSGLISYIMFKNANRFKYFWLVISFLLFVLSCLSKATAVVFPVVLILINFWMYKTENSKPAFIAFFNSFSLKNILLLLPFFAVSLFFGLMAINIQSGNNFLGMLKFIKDPHDVVNIAGSISFLQRIQIASYGFFTYIFKFIFPYNLSAYHPYPALNQGSFIIILWTAMVGAILTLFLSIRSLKRTKLYFFSLGFYFITIALVLQFMSVGTAITAERYTYLPYIGLSLIPATLITNSSARIKKTLLVLSGCFIVFLMILSRQQVKVWHDSETLWSQVIERYPDLELARSARGKYYFMLSSHAKTITEKKRLEDKALADFKVAIKAGTRTADVYEGMGIICESRNDLNNALIFLNRAISIDPKKGRSYYNRAMIYDGLNQKEKAIRDYNLALIFKPDLTVEILSNRSVLFLETGQFKEAVNDLDYLISVNPKEFMYYSNRAFAKLQLKDIDGAIADYRTVLRLKPDDQTTRKQLQALIESQISAEEQKARIKKKH